MKKGDFGRPFLWLAVCALTGIVVVPVHAGCLAPHCLLGQFMPVAWHRTVCWASSLGRLAPHCLLWGRVYPGRSGWAHDRAPGLTPLAGINPAPQLAIPPRSFREAPLHTAPKPAP